MIVSSDKTPGATSSKNLTAGGRSGSLAANKTKAGGKDKNARTNSSIENDPSATTTAFGSQTRASKSLPQSAFNTYLFSLGGTREQIKEINNSINDLVARANVKQEDMSDKILLLKKVEIKFHELAEMRKVYNFFDSRGLKFFEHEIKAAAKDRINKNNKDKNDRD